MDIKPGSHIYFMGIGGTGMAAVAGLCQEAGYKITGSDMPMYPPMSTMLEELKIPVKSPYAAENFSVSKADVVVVANALSRGNVELEALLRSGTYYTSFPALTGKLFLSKRTSIVVSGTHGKTTTSSLLAHVLFELGEDPGFIIGGIPRNFPRSFRLGTGKTFVIEGDEYDTAFFDKGPKFLHYHPNHLIVNNIEYDHADIYASVEAIEAQFEKVCALVPATGAIMANWDDPRVANLIKRNNFQATVVKVSTLGKNLDADVSLISYEAKELTRGEQLWTAKIRTKTWSDLTIETTLSGSHMLANVTQVVATIESLFTKGQLKQKPSAKDLAKAILDFKSVTRRLDHLGAVRDIDVFEDFAHHPTAVGLVIEGFKAVYPKRRLLVAFEPKNATSRRNIFQKDYVKKLGLADRVYIGPSPEDKRIAEDQRMNVKDLAKDIGKKAGAFDSNDDLLNSMCKDILPGDAIIFMSAGSFSGIQYKLIENLRKS
ncbi:MAG: Mur ligase family protein [Proteobacteria bacterium]|nr:Mur ligase family protein [Pseudomonadota bacterium]